MPVNSFDDYPMSWRPTLQKRNGPIYTQLAGQLAEDIRAGVLKPGDRLPPQRELADFLDLNFSTVTRAYKLCEQQGLICAKVGQGTFVSSDVSVSDTLLYAQEPSDCIQMGTVLPPYAGNEAVIAFVRELLNQPDAPALLEYHSPAGTYAQRRTVRRWLEGIGIHTGPENILFSTGSQNALCAAILGLFQPGDRIGAAPLSFSGLKSIAKMVGVQVVPLPGRGSGIQTEELERFCRAENLKGLYLIPDQSNPTTYSLTAEERSHIGEVAQRLGLILLEDAINRMFSDGTGCSPAMSCKARRTAVFGGCSCRRGSGARSLKMRPGGPACRSFVPSAFPWERRRPPMRFASASLPRGRSRRWCGAWSGSGPPLPEGSWTRCEQRDGPKWAIPLLLWSHKGINNMPIRHKG